MLLVTLRYGSILVVSHSAWFQLVLDLLKNQFSHLGVTYVHLFPNDLRFRRLVTESPSTPRLRVASIGFLQISSISSISHGVNPEFPKLHSHPSIDSSIRREIVWVTSVYLSPNNFRFCRFIESLLPFTLQFTFYTEL